MTSTIIPLDTLLNTEVVHYFATITGWCYRATCGDDDYTVETVNTHTAYTGTVGTAATLADSITLMEAHQAAHGHEEAPQFPTYRTLAEGRRP